MRGAATVSTATEVGTLEMTKRYYIREEEATEENATWVVALLAVLLWSPQHVHKALLEVLVLVELTGQLSLSCG